jgi:chloramphenicol-sensitive protein RarD
MGLLQYLTPVMQFAIAVLIRHEPISAAVLGGFALVWVALAVLSVDAFQHHSRIPSSVAQPEVADVDPAPQPAGLLS